jgi:hypothetical protein
MPERKPATLKETIAIGALAAAVGGYFVLVGMGVLPVPGGRRNLHAPLWIVMCAGLAFFLGGAAVLLQAIGRANERGELPAGAPQWLRVIQYLIGVAIFASFALIGSWIAFGFGPRNFSGSFLFFDGPVSSVIGRTAFGIGAIITWLCTVAFAVSGARKLIKPPQDLGRAVPAHKRDGAGS